MVESVLQQYRHYMHNNTEDYHNKCNSKAFWTSIYERFSLLYCQSQIEILKKKVLLKEYEYNFQCMKHIINHDVLHCIVHRYIVCMEKVKTEKSTTTTGATTEDTQ
jgi:hypothetical protein